MSGQTRTKPKVKQPKPGRQSTTPATESDKLMNAEIYFGPAKKMGRPKSTHTEPKTSTTTQGNGPILRSNASVKGKEKEVIIIDGSDSDGTGPNPSATNKSLKSRDSTKKCRPQPPPSNGEPLGRQGTEPILVASEVQVKIEPKEEPTLLDILAFLSATSSEPNAPNTVLLSALNAIDSSNPDVTPTENAPNPALVSALKQLLTACAQPATPVETQVASAPVSTPSTVSRHQRSSSTAQGDGIILLDKENVNPVAFKKRSEKGRMDGKNPSDSIPIASSSTSRTIRSLGPSMRPNERGSVKGALKEAFSLPAPDRSMRKRTLSDFMDEKDAGRGRDKGKERERVEKRDGHRHSSGQRSQKSNSSDSLRHYPGLLASTAPRSEQPTNYYRMPLEPWTSPVRPPRTETDENDPAANSEPPAPWSPFKQPSPRRPKISASSPVRGTKETRKKYIIPEWARTGTATQPRLSEEAQRALEEAEERKKEERNAARRRLFTEQGKLKKKGSTATLKADGKLTKEQPPPRQEFLVPKRPEAARGPIAASSDGPLITFPLISSSRPSSPPPNPIFTPKTPKTPSRNRILSTPDGDSLFTPIMRSGGLFGSAYSQRSPQGTPPSILTSPLGNRKKAKISPMRSLLTGKGLAGPGAWARMSSPKGSPKTSTDSINPDEEGNKQPASSGLEDGLEDLDCPPSSLPIASSDIDIDTSYSQSSTAVAHEGADDDTEIVPVKQHWNGLPPSSPLAPSSPILLPEDSQTDEEMDELPIATDSETDADMNVFDTDGVASPVECQAESKQLDFSAFFPGNNACAHPTSSSTMELFEQFTNVNAQSDDFPSFSDASSMDTTDMDLTNMEAMFDNGLEGMDFSEFWESFKPLLSESTRPPEQIDSDFFNAADDQQSLSFDNVDHAKLADDMQALLSGCVM